MDSSGRVLPVCFSGYQFCDCMREGRVWADVEYGERILTIIHTAGREDDSNEVYAGVFEKWCRGRFGEQLEAG